MADRCWMWAILRDNACRMLERKLIVAATCDRRIENPFRKMLNCICVGRDGWRWQLLFAVKNNICVFVCVRASHRTMALFWRTRAWHARSCRRNNADTAARRQVEKLMGFRQYFYLIINYEAIDQPWCELADFAGDARMWKTDSSHDHLLVHHLWSNLTHTYFTENHHPPQIIACFPGGCPCLKLNCNGE